MINYLDIRQIQKKVLLISMITPDPKIHLVAYTIHSKSIIYFDSYGLAPLEEFLEYVNGLNILVWYSPLPTQTLTDPLICGREVINVLTAISTSSKLLHKTVHEYTRIAL